MTQTGKRRTVAFALAAAVLGAAASLPARAEAVAPQQGEALACNPSTSLCNIQYLYYDSPSLTNQVGFADDDCGAGYVLHWGVATSYVKTRYFECPI
jgi:hypothetical protein